MKKIDRRTFIRKGGIATGGLALASSGAASGIFGENGGGNPQTTGFKGVQKSGFAAPEDNGTALVNPGMGWTMHFYSNLLQNYGSKLEPSNTLDYFPGLSVAYLRIPWAFVEPEEGKFAWETLDTPAQRWIDKSKRIALRISATETWMYYATPKWVFDAGAKGYDVEGDIMEPDYDDPVFLEKVDNFLRAMAERYDGNPNVDFIDVGHFGMWGEGHTVVTTPKHGVEWGIETQKKHIDMYLSHFKKTLLCISDDYAGHDRRGDRFPITDYAFSKGVTIRDDSILVQPPPNSWYHSEMAQLFWPTLPVILEHEHYGGSVQRGAWDRELLMKSVEDYHASYMSIHWWPDILLHENEEVVGRINRRLGYRLQMTEMKWPEKVKLGEEFTIQSQWSNAGVAPCYGGGYPCFTLKDEKGGIVSVLVDNSLNIKKLMVDAPGKAPSRELTSSFSIAPVFSDRKGQFFRACAPGTYDIFVSVGKEDGTPVFELPYGDCDGHRRYRMGRITLEQR